jgi:hypothetical protein
MRAIGLLTTALLVAGCSLLHQPPTSADQEFTVAIYNRTQVPVFVLAHQVAACSSVRMPFTDALVVGATNPPGVASVDPITIKTPRSYTGTVSLVVTEGGQVAETLGEIPDASLPPCQGGP